MLRRASTPFAGAAKRLSQCRAQAISAAPASQHAFSTLTAADNAQGGAAAHPWMAGALVLGAGTASLVWYGRQKEGSQCACLPASELVAKLSAGLSHTRDLTDDKETALVLSMASQILASGVDIEEMKKLAYGVNGAKPAPPVLISAIGAAESKMMLRKTGPHHMQCIFAMYGEQNRIRSKDEHENGQNLLVNKVKQLEWLFTGEEGKTWEIVAVDDGCPKGSKNLAKGIAEKHGLQNVTILDVCEAYKERIPFFMERGLDEKAKKSRKGGAILYGLYYCAKSKAFYPPEKPRLVMYTDSDLSTDMALCGMLSYGILNQGCSMSIGARYGQAETFLVKPPDHGAAPHPQSHFEQPNMMKIVLRHYVRVRLLPMLEGIYDTQCAFKCFKAEDLMSIINDVKSMGADFDMELLLCALLNYQKSGVDKSKQKYVFGTLFTEDFAESNFMGAAGGDPDAPYKTYSGMMSALVGMHKRYIDQNSAEAATAKDLVAFCDGMSWQTYKKMHDKLNQRGNTLFDHPFTLAELKAAAA
eukprot:TRINITY_DN5796_c0_g1_i1.p1 TRINITY_DN5796_c0_g1~~TRINITY_DN5796_c0_g1_i1.p1  ORF type:complete len:529 (-),score=116.76 TRINITY_DN5796_c0_g1_i1:164-1750(-)